MPVCRPGWDDLLGRAYAVSWRASPAHADVHEPCHVPPKDTPRSTSAPHLQEKHRLTASRQSDHYAARRAALPRSSCRKSVSSAAAMQDCYCNLCYVSQGVCHKTRRLTVAIGARATVHGKSGSGTSLWRRWKLVAHPGRWPPADVDWGPHR